MGSGVADTTQRSRNDIPHRKKECMTGAIIEGFMQTLLARNGNGILRLPKKSPSWYKPVVSLGI